MINTDTSLKNEIKNSTQELLQLSKENTYLDTNKCFKKLFIAQWFAAMIVALVVSPQTWIGATSQVHLHVWFAAIVGFILAALPIYMISVHPTTAYTRHIVGISQVLFSSLFIHLTGGRIETHFHVFTSLALLALYRDSKIFYSVTLVVLADHIIRGIYYPQSVFGILTVNQWRWVEHAFWVALEVFALRSVTQNAERDLIISCSKQAEIQVFNNTIEKDIMQLSDDLEIYLTKTTKTLSEIKNISNKVMKSSKEATLVSDQAKSDSEASTSTLQNMKSWSNEVSDAIHSVSNVANQTNILALNAAIEANRAGQAGQSFAIVANEIKELANKTTDSTKVISSTINNIKLDINETLSSMNKNQNLITQLNYLSKSIEDSVMVESKFNRQIESTVGNINNKLNNLLTNINLMKDVISENINLRNKG